MCCPQYAVAEYHSERVTKEKHMWVLILLTVGYGINVSLHDFSSKEACESAARAAVEMSNKGYYTLHVACVSK